MKFAILSDIHDNLDNLTRVLSHCSSQNIDTLIFCGDFCSPFVVKALGESGMQIHAVYGNNDGDRHSIQQTAKAFNNIHLYGEYIGDESNLLVLDSVKIGVTHYPFYAKTMVKTNWYDAVFFGHTHKVHKQKFGKALLMNPGEVAGLFGDATFAIYDTSDLSSEIVKIQSID